MQARVRNSLSSLFIVQGDEDEKRPRIRKECLFSLQVMRRNPNH